MRNRILAVVLTAAVGVTLLLTGSQADAETVPAKTGYVIVVPGPNIPFAADPPATVVVLKVTHAWCDQHGGVWARAHEGVCMDIDY